MLDHLRPGDTRLVRRLDCIAGTEQMAVETINDLHHRGVHIRGLTEPDTETTTPVGRALFPVAPASAQLRVDGALPAHAHAHAHARAPARTGGCSTVMTPARVVAAAQMRAGGDGLAQLAVVIGVGDSSVVRTLTLADVDQRGEDPTRRVP